MQPVENNPILKMIKNPIHIPSVGCGVAWWRVL